MRDAPPLGSPAQHEDRSMFTSSVCRACGEEDVVIDPLELLGKRMDFQIRIVRCLGAKWLKEDAERGVQIGYQPAL